MTYEADIGGRSGLGGTRTITAFFDSRTDAEEAIERLVSAGISRDSVRIVAGEGGATGGSVTTSSYSESGSGFWEALKDLFMPEEDRYTYAEGLRRGGYLVTLTTSDAYYEQALDILDDEGTIDIDQRAQSWRSEGWAGYEGGSASSFGGTGAATGFSTGSRSERTGLTGDQEVIEVAEEELHIGKRDVSHGRVRVRSYVVETPVSEDVHLREERVHVERRPVDRAVGANEALFQERSIELEERAEEAVVAKEARVREELVINKEVGERTERISDTVRRTEVDIEDDRDAIGSRSDLSRRSDTRR